MTNGKNIIEVVTEHKPGVLFKVSNLLRRRNFNIETLTVGVIDRKTARIIITLNDDGEVREQVIKQLNNLVEVINIRELNPQNTVKRELALIKIKVEDRISRSDVIHCIEVFRGQVVDVSRKSLIAQITGTPDKINAFIELVKPYGVKEIARTGITALERDKKEGGTS